MRNFKNGDEVWIYNFCEIPKRGVVINKIDGLDAWYVKTIRDSHAHQENKLYHYPDDAKKLYGQMCEDVFNADKNAEYFAENELTV
jgi:hypothetical protein